VVIDQFKVFALAAIPEANFRMLIYLFGTGESRDISMNVTAGWTSFCSHVTSDQFGKN
jgi:hypothetical protein